jgi:hypothetical protein
MNRRDPLSNRDVSRNSFVTNGKHKYGSKRSGRRGAGAHPAPTWPVNAKGKPKQLTTPETTLLAQLRAILDLTNTEIQIAETRVAQARTEAVRRELTQNAANGRERAEAIENAIRDLGGFPDLIGPFFGRAAAAVKALTEQAQPFDEALLGGRRAAQHAQRHRSARARGTADPRLRRSQPQ